MDGSDFAWQQGAGWSFQPGPAVHQMVQHAESGLPASWPPATGSWLSGPCASAGRAPPLVPAAAQQPGVLPIVSPYQQQPQQHPPAAYMLSTSSQQHAAPAQQHAQPLPRAASGKASGGGGKAARQPAAGGQQSNGAAKVSRAQLRAAQRKQREQDQSRIKGLEHQLGALRHQLQVGVGGRVGGQRAGAFLTAGLETVRWM
mgnify:CR=1 FL=1